MPIPYKLDYTIARVAQVQAEQAMLQQIKTKKVSTQKVQQYWTNIQDHKWYLSERLGRDIGLPAAAVDYFENICPAQQADQRPWLQRAGDSLRGFVLGYLEQQEHKSYS